MDDIILDIRLILKKDSRLIIPGKIVQQKVVVRG